MAGPICDVSPDMEGMAGSESDGLKTEGRKIKGHNCTIAWVGPLGLVQLCPHSSANGHKYADGKFTTTKPHGPIPSEPDTLIAGQGRFAAGPVASCRKKLWFHWRRESRRTIGYSHQSKQDLTTNIASPAGPIVTRARMLARTRICSVNSFDNPRRRNAQSASNS
jgi:hypothetical protein